MSAAFAMKRLAAVFLIVFSGVAGASGFQLLEQSGSGIGNAFAGSAAVAEDASTIYFNPAGMTQLKGIELSGGLSAVNPSFHFTDKGSTAGALAGTGNGGNAGGWAGLPNGYASWGVTRDLYLGIGVGVPFGLKTDYDTRWVGAAQAQLFEVKTINVNPSIAYRVNDTVSLGAGLNWQKLEASYNRLAGVLPVAASNTSLKLSMDDSSWGWNVGALFTVSPSTKVGLSYRSSIKHKLNGRMEVNNGGPGSAGIRSDLELPSTFILSVAQKLSDRWEMLGDVSLTGWSSIPHVDIVRQANGSLAQRLDTEFRNAWRIAWGANYRYNDQWKIKYGIAYDQTPVKGATTRLVSLPDNDRVWLSLGAQWSPDKASRIDLGLSYIYVRDGKVDNNQMTAIPPRGRVIGDYNGNIWVLGAQYSVAF